MDDQARAVAVVSWWLDLDGAEGAVTVTIWPPRPDTARPDTLERDWYCELFIEGLARSRKTPAAVLGYRFHAGANQLPAHPPSRDHKLA
jgi:hypothetical protein